jgi:Protein of unknown function (DUF3443)
MSGAPMRVLGASLCLIASMLMSSCGGGGDDVGVSGGGSTTSTPSGSNVATAIVDSGPANNSANTLFVSVTLCVPGSTTNCQTIDHVEVDTASYGLRILSSALTVALPVQTLNSGASLLECTNFVQGYSWGPVVAADVQIAGETASSMPLQVIGSSTYTTVPDDCTSLGTAVDTVADFGANGVLGVGPFVLDCGETCAQEATPAAYYACTGTTDCVATAVATTAQVQNPVASFTTDNNGVIVQMPSVASGGAATVSGSLIFGIDTQSNNASNAAGTETVLTVDDEDYLTVSFNGTSYTQGFIDSGSNGIYFNDTALPVCTQSGLTDFYCPSSTESLSATLTGSNGVTATADFSIANTETLFSNNTFAVFPDLGGTFPGSTQSFDLGMPFYYGRRVATVIEGDTTTVGTGPYFAF